MYLIIGQWLNQTLFVSYLHSLFWVHFVIYQWLKQTLFLRYFTDFIWVSFGIGPIFWLHLVIFHWIKQTLCVSYFTGYHLGSFINLPLIESDTMRYLFYWFFFGKSWYFTSDKSRHSVLTILLSGFGVNSAIDQWLKQKLYVSYFTICILGSFSNWLFIKADTMC